MSAHAAVEIRLLDPGGDSLVFTWQIRDGHRRVLSAGEVAGAPNTPELAGWRYQAFTEAAQAAIGTLKDLEAAGRPLSASDDTPHNGAAEHDRRCDFCAAAPAAWRYPARGEQPATVLVGDALVIVPGGDWYACPACHLLVEAGEWDTLSGRARLPLDQGDALWATFRAMRAGPPLPLDSREGRADA
jgi:hypothetical protein